MPLGETITVVNKSGKIVSSVSRVPLHHCRGARTYTDITQSKQLVNVWKEARAAYRERKAEIEAARVAEYERQRAERRALRYLEDDRASRTSSKRSGHPHRSKTQRHTERPSASRGYTDTYYGDAHEHGRSQPRQRSALRTTIDDEALPIRNKELIRRHTDGDYLTAVPTPRRHSEPHNSRSARSSIDMDLAYGELPPPIPQPKYVDNEELRGKMSNLTKMLDEANCLQYSVTSMVEHLQKNPDALAAVALTLAEISNLVTKMAPGALGAMKGLFPAATALLMSPQFLIAAGLGVGVTVVMLGGYKVIKRIKEAQGRELEAPIAMDQQLEELEDVDLSRIEMWRRGIADAEAESSGSTVDGEFITPDARTRLAQDGVLDDARSTRSRKSRAASQHGRKAETSSKAGTSSGHRKDKDKEGKKKPKKSSGLKFLLRPASSR